MIAYHWRLHLVIDDEVIDLGLPRSRPANADPNAARYRWTWPVHYAYFSQQAMGEPDATFNVDIPLDSDTRKILHRKSYTVPIRRAILVLASR